MYECGARSADEAGQILHNQCFYLSLAAALRNDLQSDPAAALRLKRLFEAAVRLVRGAHFGLQDEAGAFADFLADAMTSHAHLRHRTVAVFNSVEGSVTFYRDPVTVNPASSVVGLFYTVRHYQWIRWGDPALLAGDLTRALLAPAPGAGAIPHVLVDAAPPALVDLVD